VQDGQRVGSPRLAVNATITPPRPVSTWKNPAIVRLKSHAPHGAGDAGFRQALIVTLQRRDEWAARHRGPMSWMSSDCAAPSVRSIKLDISGDAFARIDNDSTVIPCFRSASTPFSADAIS
jgi:hypothetical protein